MFVLSTAYPTDISLLCARPLTMAPPPPPRLVDNPQIKSAELLSPAPFFFHAYIWPFSFIWPAFLAVYLSPERYDHYIGGQEWTFVWVGTIITFQSLAWLTTHWSVNLRATFTAYKVSSVSEAQLIKVSPVANAGAADICKIDRERVSYHFPICYCTQLYDADGLSFYLGRRQDQRIVPVPEAPILV